jgi:hypothetical protein
LNYFKHENGDNFLVKNKCHKYGSIYDYYFSEKKNEVNNFLEIGVQHGSSIKMWKDYFPNATIWGIDIKIKWTDGYKENRIKLLIGNQNDGEFLDSIDCMFDFIVDDGSHNGGDQVISFKHLFPKLVYGGIYFVEDTFFPYRGTHDYEFLNFCKSKIDKFQLYGKTKHMDYYEGAQIMSSLNDKIYAMHIYTGLIAFIKADK